MLLEIDCYFRRGYTSNEKYCLLLDNECLTQPMSLFDLYNHRLMPNNIFFKQTIEWAVDISKSLISLKKTIFKSVLILKADVLLCSDNCFSLRSSMLSVGKGICV